MSEFLDCIYFMICALFFIAPLLLGLCGYFLLTFCSHMRNKILSKKYRKNLKKPIDKDE